GRQLRGRHHQRPRLRPPPGGAERPDLHLRPPLVDRGVPGRSSRHAARAQLGPGVGRRPRRGRAADGRGPGSLRLRVAAQRGRARMREAGRGGGSVALLVATDLDASLLDAASYRWDEARPALRALAERGARLVLCTSKTRSETEVIAAELPAASRPALVVENGGALVVPVGDLERPDGRARRDGDDWVIDLGVARAALIASLRDIVRETGCAVTGFADLGTDEIARLTGLDPEAARRAGERDYDEPVLVEGGEDAALRVAAAAARRGLRLVKGGRFHHLTGNTDKGRALRVLVDLHAAEGRRFTTIG